MRRVVLAMVVLAGCKSDSGHFPVGPGGGGVGGGGTAPDAAIDGGGDGASGTISGRVCLAADPRNLAGCASTGAGGLTVALGGNAATTAEDGTFVITRPAAATMWEVSGGTIVPTVAPFTSVVTIPALDTTTYDNLLSANAVILNANEGDVMVSVVRNGVPVSGVTATLSPVQQYATFYDGSNATVWNQNSTGAYGTVWFPGATAGTASVTVSGVTIASVPVIAGAITFVTAALP